MDSYAGLKTKIDETIGAINGKYSTINWTPVYYFYHSFNFQELVAMYNIADIALVTPLRDGMPELWSITEMFIPATILFFRNTN